MNWAQHGKVIAKHFKYSVCACLKVSPSPSSSKELHYIYSHFNELPSNLEYFTISKDKSGLKPFGSYITVMYNPVSGSCFSEINFKAEKSNLGHIELKIQRLQQEIIEQLNTICALPRFSYIEEDEYLEGKWSIPFKYRLNRKGLKYENLYNVTASTVHHGFAMIEAKEESGDGQKLTNSSKMRKFKRNIRHNFQKFHKFDVSSIHIGGNAVKWIQNRADRILKPKYEFLRDKHLSNRPHDVIDGSNGVKSEAGDLTCGFFGFTDDSLPVK